MVEVGEYPDAEESSPYAGWFDRLYATATVKVYTAIHLVEGDNFSNNKGHDIRGRQACVKQIHTQGAPLTATKHLG